MNTAKYKIYGVGNKYGLDLESIWNLFAGRPEEEGEIDLTYGKRLRFTREGNRKYFDLISNITNEIVCMDGEVCEILYEEEPKNDGFDGVRLLELVEEDTQIRFVMTRKEFVIAVMC